MHAPVAHSPVAGLSALQWQAARAQAAEWHAAQRARMWTAPKLTAQPRRPSRSQRRRAGVVAALALAGMVAAATAMVVVSDEPAQAYSLNAAAMRAQQTNTLSYEATTSMADGTTNRFEVDMDLDRGLTSMTMDDGSVDQWQYVVDMNDNVMYVGAAKFTELGLHAGGAQWVSFDLGELIDVDLSAMYDQVGENPLDATLLFDVADDIVDLGFDDVRGERVKHYQVTVDEHAVLGTSKQTTSGFVNDGQTDAVGKDVYDVYVNRSNQMVRLSYGLEIVGQYVSVDLMVTRVDEQLDIVVPRKSDVIAYDDLEF
jgi:hypothetical protein